MAVAVENGGVMMESVDEVEAADEVIEEVVFYSNDITFLLLKYFFFRWSRSWTGSGFSNSSNSYMIV